MKKILVLLVIILLVGSIVTIQMGSVINDDNKDDNRDVNCGIVELNGKEFSSKSDLLKEYTSVGVSEDVFDDLTNGKEFKVVNGVLNLCHIGED
jgi:hypothetical protein